MLKLTEELYQTLRELHIVASKYEFSQEWLGRCRSYTTSLEAQKRGPSTDALASAFVRLQALVAQLEATEHKTGWRMHAHALARLRALQGRIGLELTGAWRRRTMYLPCKDDAR